MKKTFDPSNETIFEGILNGKLSAKFLYEDDQVAAFLDIAPKAPIHFLVVPRARLVNLTQATQTDQVLLGHLLYVAAQVAEQLGLNEKGYRIVINNGSNAHQEVPHLHLHVLGGGDLKSF